MNYNTFNSSVVFSLDFCCWLRFEEYFFFTFIDIFRDCDFFGLSNFVFASLSVFDDACLDFDPGEAVLTFDPGDAVFGFDTGDATFAFAPGDIALGLVCGLGSLKNIRSLLRTFHSSRYSGFRGVLPSSCIHIKRSTCYKFELNRWIKSTIVYSLQEFLLRY